MKRQDFGIWWSSLVHWKGWKTMGSGIVRGWKAMVSWRGWETCFALPLAVVALLSVACGAGLILVFVKHLEMWWPAYVLYGLSAYCLVALCVKLPGAIRMERDWVHNHPDVEKVLKNKDLKFSVGLYIDQVINFTYGIFKIVSGVVIGSAWIGADGIYNLAQALIQLFQILRRKKPGTIHQQWKSYRFCGVLILLMHLTLTGIVFQMVNWNRVEESGEIMIIATAAFAFYKLIDAFLSLAKDRKHTHPVDSSVRMLKLSQAIFAIFALQAGMLHTFGTGEAWEHWINLAVGCVVCMLTAAIGVYMICRGNRELKTLQENNYGE